eukprot:Skav222724  [mRNA]  locus=scaffold2390:142227:142886:+ [translate_table: standard]
MGHFREQLTVDKDISIRCRCVGSSDLLAGLMASSLKGWVIHFPWEGVIPEVGQMCSLLDFTVSQIDASHVLLQPTVTSQVLFHSGEVFPSKAVELCCGLGGMSTGAEAAGLQVVAGVDCSAWALHVFSCNHAADGLLGSVACSTLRAQLFSRLQGHAVGYLMGFPCPPFSSRGDQRGFQDQRAWTLVHGLDLVYLFNGQFLILECTPRVESFDGVVQFH